MWRHCGVGFTERSRQMTNETSHERSDLLKDEAIAWLVRLQSDQVTGEDWTALAEWLQQSPDHLQAFEWAEAFDQSLDSLVPALSLGGVANVAQIIPFRPRPREKLPAQPGRLTTFKRFAAGIAAAAAVFGVTTLVTAPRKGDYATTAEETQAVRLSDGSVVTLDANSRIHSEIGVFSRKVRLLSGEASFDVTHDSAHPFQVEIGDKRVTVLGTEFNVDRVDDTTTITVRRGRVRLSQIENSGDVSALVSLTKGEQVTLTDHETHVAARNVNADDAFAWQNAHLVCDDMALSRIVAYANRRYRYPILIGPAIGARRFSGVLNMENQASFVHALAIYMSLSEQRTERGFSLR